MSEELKNAQAMRAEIGKLVEISKSIDEAWKAGDRSMMAAAVWSLSDATQKMFAALQAQDGAAFFAAAENARERAFSAVIHGRNWRKAQAQ